MTPFTPPLLTLLPPPSPAPSDPRSLRSPHPPPPSYPPPPAPPPATPSIDLLFIDHEKTMYLQDLKMIEASRLLRKGSVGGLHTPPPTPYEHVLFMRPIYLLYLHALLTHTPSTHPINTPHQHSLLILPTNTPYQHAQSLLSTPHRWWLQTMSYLSANP